MKHRATKLPAWLMASTAVLLAATAASAQPATTNPTTAQPVYPAPATADPVEALGRYLRVLSTMPRNLDALTGAGKAALAIGDANAAISFFARAEEISPRDGRIKFGLASALVQVEQPKTALKLFGDAVSLGVPEGEVAGERGLAYDLRGDSRRAQADYMQSLRWRPDDEITRRLAVSQAISGDRQAALATLDALLRRQDRAAWRIRAFVLALTGDQKGAQEVAVAVMPRGQADALTPYFGRLAGLAPAQKAAAVHLGQFPSDGRSAGTIPPAYADAAPSSVPPPVGGPRSDVPLIPSGTALGSSQAVPDAGDARAPRRRPGTTELAGFSSAVTGASAVNVPSRPTYQAGAASLRTQTDIRSGPAPSAVATTSLPTTSAPPPAVASSVPPSSSAATRPAYTPQGAMTTASLSQPVASSPQTAASAAASAAPRPTYPTTISPNAVTATAQPLTSPASRSAYAPPTTTPTPTTSASAVSTAAIAQAPAPATQPLPMATSASAAVASPIAVSSPSSTPSATTVPVAAPPVESAAQVSPDFSADPLGTPAVAASQVASPPAEVFGPPRPVELAMASPSPAATSIAASAPAVRAIDLPVSAAAEPVTAPVAPSPPVAATVPVHRPVSTPMPQRQSRLIAPAAKSPAKDDAEEKVVATKSVAKGREATRGKTAADDKPTRIAAADTPNTKSRAGTTKSDKSDAKNKDKADTASVTKDAKGKDAKGKEVAATDAKSKDTAAKDAKGKDIAAKEAKSKDAKGKDGKSKDVATREADAKDKPDKATKTPAGERYWVQVASGANRSDLGKAWERTKAKAPKLLGGRATYTAPWKQSNRLLVGPFKSEDEAQGFVNSLSKAGTGGIQFTSRGGMKVEPLGSE